MVSIPTLWAMEFDAQIEKTIWQYNEYAKDVAGYAQLPAEAAGDGAVLTFRLSTERNEDWYFAATTSIMDSLSTAEETWNHGQVNDLSMKQQDIRLDMQYRMLGARFGVWVANRKQIQSRENFFLNGVRSTPATGEPNLEEIRSNWAGLSLTSVGGNVDQFEVSLDAAFALNVETTNPMFTDAFTKKDGYRTGVNLRWTLPEQEVGLSGLNIILRYEYQELGGEETVANGFWPYNRWQVASMGLMYAW
ncbi:MAG: hypothetical protein R8M46_06585 [Ghiorsea sp.]